MIVANVEYWVVLDRNYPTTWSFDHTAFSQAFFDLWDFSLYEKKHLKILSNSEMFFIFNL